VLKTESQTILETSDQVVESTASKSQSAKPTTFASTSLRLSIHSTQSHVSPRERIHPARRWHTWIDSVADMTSLPRRTRHRPPLPSILGKAGAHDANDGTVSPLRTCGPWASTFRSLQSEQEPSTPVSPPMPLRTSGNVEARSLWKRLSLSVYPRRRWCQCGRCL